MERQEKAKKKKGPKDTTLKVPPKKERVRKREVPGKIKKNRKERRKELLKAQRKANRLL